MDGNERGDGVILDVIHRHGALPHHAALVVFQLLAVPAIELGLVNGAGFNLRQQPVAHPDHLHAQLVHIDGGDRHAGDIVARQDDAAIEPHQRRLVAQFHRHDFFRDQGFAGGGGQPGFQGDIVGLVEGQARQAQPVVHHPAGNPHGGINGDVILIVGLATGIELAGKDQAGLGLGLGDVNLQPAKGKVAGLVVGRRGQVAGDGGQPALQPPQDRGVRGVIAPAQEPDARHRHDQDGRDGAARNEEKPRVLVHSGPRFRRAKRKASCCANRGGTMTKR